MDRFIRPLFATAMVLTALVTVRNRKFVPISSTVHHRSLRSDFLKGLDTSASSELDLDDGLSGPRN